ncbi:hypothetical protein [Gluconobacter kondonii]|uniref:hypothetical protein n=1 Tax=Gluconobacter kondonii TaxID=941463 RepID=UPI001B8AB69C|nr:hypothetical protein [Gluconobacter kondonii]MBS1057049.1 hypothetical protein [Gluconobacter kondonii]
MSSKPKVKWWLEAAENRLWEAGVEVATIEAMASGYGSTIKTRDGRMICVYDTGSLVCQGKLIPETKLIFEEPPSGERPQNIKTVTPSSTPRPSQPDEAAKDQSEPKRPLGPAYKKSHVIITEQGNPDDVMPWD